MQNWYFLVDGKIQGPTSESKIREMLRSGSLTLHDIVFRQGDPKWLRINEFTDLDFSKEVQTQNLSAFVDLPQEKTENKTPSSSPQEWIVLVKIRNQSETKFVQQGPFSLDEIKQSIQNGQYRYNDFVWKKGFEKWERIGDLEEFSFKGETQIFSIAGLTQTHKQSLTQTQPEVPSSTKFPEAPANLSGIKVQKRKNIPQKSDDDEFTKTEIKTQKTKTVKLPERTQEITAPIKSQSVNAKTQSRVNKSADSIGFDTAQTRTILHRSSKKKRRQLNRVIQVALLVVIIGGMIIILQNLFKRGDSQPLVERTQDLSSRKTNKKPSVSKKENVKAVVAQKIVEKPIISSEAPSPAAPLPVQPIPVVKEEPKIVSAPPASKLVPKPVVARNGKAYVKIKMVDINGKNPKILFSSNAVEGEDIEVKIRGVTGELLGLPSFNWSKTLRRRGGVDPSVAPKNIGIRPGFYFVSATLDDVLVETGKIFVGEKRDFSKKIEEHRKQISFRQQQEKKQLFRLMSDLTSQADLLFSKYRNTSNAGEFVQFLNGWKTRVRGISSEDFRSFNQRTQNNYAFPEMWQEVRGVKEKLLAEAEKLESSFDSTRKTAADISASVIGEIQKLFQRIAELSGWKAKKL